MEQVENHQAQLEENLKEITAKRNLEDAKLINIRRNHPFILELTDLQLFTAHMYQEALIKEKKEIERMKEVMELIEEYKEESAHIREVLGVPKKRKTKTKDAKGK